MTNDFINSIRQLAIRIGVMTGTPSAYEIDLIDIDNTPDEIPFLILQSGLAELIKESKPEYIQQLVDIRDEDRPGSCIFFLNDSSVFALLMTIGSIYEKLEKELKNSELQKNILKIQEHIKKIVRETKADDVVVEVTHEKNWLEKFEYKVSVRLGEGSPFVFSHESPRIIMIVVDSGMKNILDRISAPEVSEIAELPETSSGTD